jgi:hypothetical protein
VTQNPFDSLQSLKLPRAREANDTEHPARTTTTAKLSRAVAATALASVPALGRYKTTFDTTCISLPAGVLRTSMSMEIERSGVCRVW